MFAFYSKRVGFICRAKGPQHQIASALGKLKALEHMNMIKRQPPQQKIALPQLWHVHSQ